MDAKPWLDVMSAEDIESFSGGFDKMEREMAVGTKPALVIVDMTRAFVDSAYPTGWSPAGYPAADANRRLLDVAREASIPIYFTKAYADPEYQPVPAERGMWRTGGSRPVVSPDLPPGDVIVDVLTPLPGEVVINKGSKPSGFFGTQLASLLAYEGVDTVIVTGMTTSGCVRATVLDAFQYNYNVLIPFECSADRSQLSHKVSLFDMHMKYADVFSLDETVEYLEKVTDAVAMSV